MAWRPVLNLTDNVVSGSRSHPSPHWACAGPLLALAEVATLGTSGKMTTMSSSFVIVVKHLVLKGYEDKKLSGVNATTQHGGHSFLGIHGQH